MAGLSDYAELKVLDHSLGTTSWTVPAGAFISLHDADPSDTGADEITGGSYARQGDTVFAAAAAGTTDNDSAISFTLMPAVTVTHVGIWDAVSGGNFVWGGSLAASKVVNAGDTFTIAAGDLDVSVD